MTKPSLETRRAFGVGCCLLVGALLAGCADSEPNGLVLSGVVRALDEATMAGGAPLDDVSVCQFASNNCTVTDDEGRYALPLLFNREVQVAYEKSGFGPVLVGYRTERDDIVGDPVMATDDMAAEFAAELGTPYPPVDSGFVTVTAFRGPASDDIRLAGVSFSLIGSAGRGYYLDDAGIPNSTLVATQSPGIGGFVEVNPNPVTLEVRGTAVNCTSPASWLADGTNRFRLPVRSGFSTQTSINCE